MVGMSTSRTRVASILEANWGVTPATPAFQTLRMTGESLNADKVTTTSNEIRPDRNVADLIQTGRSAAGNIEAEMSYGTYDAFLASALEGAWASNVLKNGTTQTSFTIEKTLDRPTGNDEFHRFAGCMVNTLALNIQADSIITASLGLMAKGVSRAAAAITGATYANANTEDIMSAATDFSALTITGLGTSPAIQNLQINTTNNLRQQRVVGSIDAAGIADGRLEVTGSMNAYFDDPALYDAFLNNTAFSLSFLMGTVSTKRYLASLPKVKITSMQVTSGGNDQDIMAAINFQALFDQTSGCTMSITRGQ